MKKGILSSIIILLFAGFVFYTGYASIKVPSASYGILVSKTSGVYPKLIENGKFCWRWEFLIPRNSKLYIFSDTPRHFKQAFNGELPSASIYSSLIKGNPDFSYSFDFEFYLKIESENLISVFKTENFKSDEDLYSYLENVSLKISRDLSQKLIEMNENTVIASYNVPEIIQSLDLEKKYSPVLLKDVYIKKANVPDLRLYNIARSSYDKFQSVVDEKLSEYASAHAEKIIADENSVKKLTKIGEMLKQYPELNALLSNGSTADVLKALNDLK